MGPKITTRRHPWLTRLGCTHDRGRLPMTPAKKTKSLKASLENVAQALREIALSYPEAWEDFPWGHSGFKVRKKIFFSMGGHEEYLSMSFKLPQSNQEALLLPFTKALVPEVDLAGGRLVVEPPEEDAEEADGKGG